jgi:hypothetical protein
MTKSRTIRKKKPDLTDSTYLDRLGVEWAQKRAPGIRNGAVGFGLTLPLDDLRVNYFISDIIEVLDGAKMLDWLHTPSDRKSVFLMSLFTEFQRLGIAE